MTNRARRRPSQPTMALALQPIVDHLATRPLEMQRALDALSSLSAGNAGEHNEVQIDGCGGLTLQMDLDGEVSITIETAEASLFSNVIYLQTSIADTVAYAAGGRRLGDLIDFGASAFSLLCDVPILNVQSGDPAVITLDAPMSVPLHPVVNPVLR